MQAHRPQFEQSRLDPLDPGIQSALPYRVNMPTSFSQLPDDPGVPHAVPFNLRKPKFLVAFRHTAKAAGVAMPETTVDEHYRAQTGKDQIRGTWQATPNASAITKASGPKGSSHGQFRLCATATYRAHDLRTAGGTHCIDHVVSVSMGKKPGFPDFESKGVHAECEPVIKTRHVPQDRLALIWTLCHAA